MQSEHSEQTGQSGQAEAAAYKVVMIKPQDHVAVALSAIPAGAALSFSCQGSAFEVTLLEAVEFGHKFAVKPIAGGEDILKYGEVIGTALFDIAQGAHVHVHNLEGKRGRGDQS